MADSIWSAQFQWHLSEQVWASCEADYRREGLTDEQIAEQKKIFDEFAKCRAEIAESFKE